MILTLYDYLRVGHVKRWHNVNVIRQQTVAEHSMMVLLIAMELWITTRKETTVPAGLMLRVVFHDVPEVVAGDIPTPAKHFLREFTNDPELFDKIDKALLPRVPYSDGDDPKANLYERYVKMADKIEATHWITENGAGTHATVVARSNWRQLEDLVEEFDNTGPQLDWYGAVNKVLMALGMDYVHKQSRISKP